MTRAVEDPPPPPLSWRTWLLVPLVAVGILGLAVPYIRLNPRPPAAADPPPAVERFPYDGALLPILEQGDLSREELKAFRERHERLLRENDEHGGVTRRALDDVQRTIETLKLRRRK